MWAIVPIKTFEKAKQRLANVLTPEERKSLMLAMARDVLTSLSGSKSITGVLIVSRSSESDALSQTFNTERFAESPDANLAIALKQATHYLVDNFNAKGVFVIPADVPGIQASEIDQLILNHVSVTILPDVDRIGTNGLICSPPFVIPYIFNGKSFKPHADAAFERKLTPIVVPNSCFSLDIDHPSDLVDFHKISPGSQTGIFLTRSGIIKRLSDIKHKKNGSNHE